MKKRISLLIPLSLSMMLGFFVPVSASDSQASTSPQQQTLTTKVFTIEWELEIPAEVTIPDGGYSHGVKINTVKINIVKGDYDKDLDEGDHIDAFLNYDGILKSGTGEKLNYRLSPENPSVGQEEESYETRKVNTKIKIGQKTRLGEASGENYKDEYDNSTAWVGQDDWDAAVNGTYSGTITYTSELIKETAGN